MAPKALAKERKAKISPGNLGLCIFLQEYVKQGLLVPDDIVNAILKKTLPKDNFVLDGYPRTLSQAKLLDNIAKIDKVIYLDVPDAVIIKRLATRLQCPKCHAIYGLNRKPKRDMLCDYCNIKLVRREDDEPEKIKIRLEQFYKATKSLLKYYHDRLIVVDGSKTENEVFNEIMAKLALKS